MNDPLFSNPIETKTTTIKSAEPLKIKAVPFAKGYKLEITYQFDPNNPIQLDQLMLKVEESNVRSAIKYFKEKIIVEDLGSKLLEDKE